MTAEERMRERAAQWCRDFASSRTIHNTTFPDTAARSALQLEQAIRALPLEGEQGQPAPAREPAVKALSNQPSTSVLIRVAYEHAEELDRLRAENAAQAARLEELSVSYADVRVANEARKQELAALREKLAGGVVVPRKAWEGFLSLVSVQLGKPTNRDKSPAEIVEMARAVLVAAKEPKK